MAGKHKEAVKLAKQIVAVEPNEGALKLLANDAIFPGDYVSGIHWIKEIMKVKSTPDLFNQLGMLYLKMGEHFAENDKYEEAMIQYAAATKEFQHAADLDPIKTSALISKVKVLRLQKKYPEALKLANQLYDKYPSSVDVIQQLVNIYKDQGEYATARKWLEVKHPFFQGNTELQKNIAKFTFYSGEQKEGLQMMEKLRDASSSQSVQVLLFHGITASKRQSTVPVHLFRDQMLALKEAGYHSISVAQLLSFLDGKEELPDKPILITFDDARRDSIQYADPVLEEAGFQATMFVPVADISTHGVFTVVWPTLRTISKTGRWEMQCHSTEGQHFLPVDKNGYQGHFMANKKWLKNADRQETTEEFTTRITQDLKFCKEAMENKIPGSDVFAFAFPFSDQGHRSLSNEPEAFTLNHDIVKNQFQLAFHVNNDYPVTKNSPRFSLPRFEVPRTLTGKDLVKQLKTIEPAISVPYALARLKMDAGQYDQAIKILDKLERDGGIDKAELLAKKGRILRWSGDYTGARKQLEKARALQPNNPIVLTDIAVLDSRLKDVVKIDGQYIEDNANRSYYSFGSTVEIPISDGLSLAAYYKYLNFDQQFTTGLLTEEHHFRAHGHQFEGKVNYEI
ncbi:MAG: polysaccharide deacetylase family protein, partial [Gammaproteobacteria bacterium]|nr:polysaccharide deacetylase family protein [Gammaproteobacteria bacterium]